eukprot:COSAG06_NODE_31941_length_513_cov_3.741546_1_plen_24_part_10
MIKLKSLSTVIIYNDIYICDDISK